MNRLLELLEKYRPEFEEGGRFAALHPVFFTLEHILFSPAQGARHHPHVRDALDIKRYMSMVIAALLPSIGAAIYFFGWRVLAMIVVSYAVGGTVEVLFAILRKEEINEGFLVTGLIFPLVLPPTTPLWVVAVGIFIGVFFGKEVFGGTGRNIFNPALVGRLFVTVSFPAIMTTRWRIPGVDGVTAATPLSVFKTTGETASYMDLLLGNVAGSVGETFSLGIIAGGLFLLLTKVGNWRIPLSYIGMVLLLSLVGHNFLPDQVGPMLFQLLSGGLLFGAFFMATDPVSSPSTRSGKYVFGIGCGLLTVVIRAFSGYVEGVMFSIVIMNAFAPLIDHMVLSARYKPVQI